MDMREKVCEALVEYGTGFEQSLQAVDAILATVKEK